MKPLELILRRFLDLHPEDAARVFETLDFAEALRLFKSLPTSVAVTLLEGLNVTTGARIIEQVEAGRVVELPSAVSMGQSSSLIHCLEDSRKAAILEALPVVDFDGRFGNFLYGTCASTANYKFVPTRASSYLLYRQFFPFQKAVR